MKVNKNQRELLDKIVLSKECFDRRENTFQLNDSAIGRSLKVSRDKVGRLMRTLKKQDVIREIVGADQSTALMLSLSVYARLHPIEHHFHSILWSLRDYNEAINFTKKERQIGWFIDPETGECLSKIYKRWYALYTNYIEDYFYDRFGPSMESRRVERKRHYLDPLCEASKALDTNDTEETAETFELYDSYNKPTIKKLSPKRFKEVVASLPSIVIGLEFKNAA
ncbi:hypothetical protein [Shewanella aquimarina]|uniref:hypothetical protein n=1 Tax=Shewanella aquimarina TaxID=260365 RepID=UPI002014EA94|nr:hypothetical protein [Shewanella aquimarina]MCL2908548.1 hypothetical protein [Shewanella aquimarina]